MKLIILVILLLVSYQGYAPNQPIRFETKSRNEIKWNEQQIINILEKGEVLFCKYDLFLERNDTTFYVKNMELPIIKDVYFTSAYIESSILYSKSKKDQKDIHCTYLIMNDKWGNILEVMEDEIVCLPKLSKYLDNKIKHTQPKECLQGYIPLD